MVGTLVQQHTVVGHQQKALPPATQIPPQPCPALGIQVVGRFVDQGVAAFPQKQRRHDQCQQYAQYPQRDHAGSPFL